MLKIITSHNIHNTELLDSTRDGPNWLREDAAVDSPLLVFRCLALFPFTAREEYMASAPTPRTGLSTDLGCVELLCSLATSGFTVDISTVVWSSGDITAALLLGRAMDWRSLRSPPAAA